jgi:hypothetical protein
MKTTNMDRILGVFCTLLVFTSVIFVFKEFSWSWSWVILLIWTVGLGFWDYDGWQQKIPVGSVAELLFLEERMSVYLREGRRWIPKIFGKKVVDCRARTTKLDATKVFTKDNIEVIIREPSIVWEVFEVHKYLDLDPEDLPKLLDDVVDQNVRKEIRKTPYDDAVGMEFGIRAETLEHWGIRVVKVLAPNILPADPKILEDLQLKAAEERERTGQLVEAEFDVQLLNLFEKGKDEGGGGLNHSEAVEMTQLTTGKAIPKNLTGITLSPEIARAAAELLGRKS